MADKKNTTSNTDNQAQQAFEMFRNFAEEQQARIGKMMDEWKRFEAEGAEKMTAAVDEMGRLFKSSIDYSVQAGTEWRSYLEQMATEARRFVKQ